MNSVFCAHSMYIVTWYFLHEERRVDSVLMIDQENIRKAIRQYRDRWRTFRYWTVVEIAVMTAAVSVVLVFQLMRTGFYYEGTVEQTQTVTVPVPVETTEEDPEAFVTVTTEDRRQQMKKRRNRSRRHSHEYAGYFQMGRVEPMPWILMQVRHLRSFQKRMPAGSRKSTGSPKERRQR